MALNCRLAGIELYFDDLEAAKCFYEDTLGLTLWSEQPGHHAQFDAGPAFLCLERKGVENYPSRDKAVIFLIVPSVPAAVAEVGPEKIVHFDTGTTERRPWAVLHDPEGHNVILLEEK